MSNDWKDEALITLPAYATRQNFKWATFLVMVILHLAVLAAPFTFTWAGLAVFAFLVWATGGLGITTGYHRLLTHSSFKTSKFMTYFFLFFAALALQGGPIFWVSTHRFHHKESDQE